MEMKYWLFLIIIKKRNANHGIHVDGFALKME